MFAKFNPCSPCCSDTGGCNCRNTDIMLLMDTSGTSYLFDDTIIKIKSLLSTLESSSCKIGVSEFRGFEDDFVFRINQPITDNFSLVHTAIDGLNDQSPTSPGSFPKKDYYYGINDLAINWTSASVGGSSNSNRKRVIIVVSNMLPYDCGDPAYYVYPSPTPGPAYYPSRPCATDVKSNLVNACIRLFVFDYWYSFSSNMSDSADVQSMVLDSGGEIYKPRDYSEIVFPVVVCTDISNLAECVPASDVILGIEGYGDGYIILSGDFFTNFYNGSPFNNAALLLNAKALGGGAVGCIGDIADWPTVAAKPTVGNVATLGDLNSIKLLYAGVVTGNTTFSTGKYREVPESLWPYLSDWIAAGGVLFIFGEPAFGDAIPVMENINSMLGEIGAAGRYTNDSPAALADRYATPSITPFEPPTYSVSSSPEDHWLINGDAGYNNCGFWHLLTVWADYYPYVNTIANTDVVARVGHDQDLYNNCVESAFVEECYEIPIPKSLTIRFENYFGGVPLEMVLAYSPSKTSLYGGYMCWNVTHGTYGYFELNATGTGVGTPQWQLTTPFAWNPLLVGTFSTTRNITPSSCSPFSFTSPYNLEFGTLSTIVSIFP